MRGFRRPLAVIVLSLLLVGLVACGDDDDNGGDSEGTAASEDVKQVALDIIINNLPVNQNVDGFKEAMAEAGFEEGVNVEYKERNAQGQTANANLIASQSVDAEPDLIYVVGTPIVIALAQQTDSIPVVFSLMTDPVGAGVVDSFESPGTNFTGTSDAVDPVAYFDLLEQLLPDAQTVGLMGNTGEQNSESQLKQFEAEAEERGLGTVVAPTQTTNDVAPAMRSLVGQVDVVLVGADGTVLAAVDSVISAARQAKMPLILNGSAYAKDGSLVGVGPNFRELGRASGEIVARVLNGEDPAEIPVVDAVEGGGLKISINETVVSDLGITIPPELEQEATLVE